MSYETQDTIFFSFFSWEFLMRETRFLKHCCPGHNSHGLILSPDFSETHRLLVLGSAMSIHIVIDASKGLMNDQDRSRLEIACSEFFRFSIFFIIEEGTHSEIFRSETKIIFN